MGWMAPAIVPLEIGVCASGPLPATYRWLAVATPLLTWCATRPISRRSVPTNEAISKYIRMRLRASGGGAGSRSRTSSHLRSLHDLLRRQWLARDCRDKRELLVFMCRSYERSFHAEPSGIA